MLGAITAAHFVGTGARNAAFPSVARPRYLRVKRAIPAAVVRGAKLAAAAAVVHATLHVATTTPTAAAAAAAAAGDRSGSIGVGKLKTLNPEPSTLNLQP